MWLAKINYSFRKRFTAAMINFKIILIFQIKSFSVTSLKVKFLKLWDFSGYYERTTSQKAYLPKISIPGQIVLEILVQLCFEMTPYKFF